MLNASSGAYTYTLTSPYDTTPDADNGTNTEGSKDHFDYTVTDANGNTTTGTIYVDIVDDVPMAYADSNSVTEGASVSGNVLSDGTADVFGADGPTVAGEGVVGVRAAGGDTTSDVTTGVGSSIVGLYGTLTLGANGGYTYVGNDDAVTADAEDVFVYTIKDADGDLSTTTLTIDVNNVTVLASDDEALVNEAGLDSGSAADDSDIFNGQIAASGGTRNNFV